MEGLKLKSYKFELKVKDVIILCGKLHLKQDDNYLDNKSSHDCEVTFQYEMSKLRKKLISPEFELILGGVTFLIGKNNSRYMIYFMQDSSSTDDQTMSITVFYSK